MERVNWGKILRHASKSLQEEGRHNQASILKDAAAELERLQAIEKALEKFVSSKRHVYRGTREARRLSVRLDNERPRRASSR